MSTRGAHRARALLHRRLPRRLRRGWQRLTRTTVAPFGAPPGAVAEQSPLFADDVRQLRPYVSGPFDGWGIG